MAGEAARRAGVRYDEYLTFEQQADRKHEWLDGEIFAMAGGTPIHGALASAMIGELRNALLKCGCVVYSSDVRVRVPATGLATYPDASVVCGPLQTDPEDANAIVNPAVIVEVLSDSTEAWDRGDKFEHLQQLATLRDYVLVSQHARRIEHYARGEQGKWVLSSAIVGQSIQLTAMDAAIEVDRVYAGIEVVPRAPRSERVS